MASAVSGYSAASSAMYQSTIASTGIKRETFSDRMTQTRFWLYNPENGEVMGRRPVDWAIYAVCIFVYIFALTAMFVVFCALFYWAVDWNNPTLQKGSSILQIPGLGFRPQPDVSSTLVRFIKGDTSTYFHYLDHIEAYIQYYENDLQVGDNYKDCNEINDRRTEDLEKVCVFDVQVLGGDCVKQQNYGFDDGQPCILLKLNRIFDWVPEEYTSDTVHEDLVANISDIPSPGDLWKASDPWWVHVVCFADDFATAENMGDLSYHPQQGFHFKYYPFKNQQGFRSPLMFLRFENPTPGVLLMMTCKAYAKNIVARGDRHDHVAQVASVHFEVLVD